MEGVPTGSRQEELEGGTSLERFSQKRMEGLTGRLEEAPREEEEKEDGRCSFAVTSHGSFGKGDLDGESL